MARRRRPPAAPAGRTKPRPCATLMASARYSRSSCVSGLSGPVARARTARRSDDERDGTGATASADQHGPNSAGPAATRAAPRSAPTPGRRGTRSPRTSAQHGAVRDVALVEDVPHAIADAERERQRADSGRKMRSGLKIVITRSRIRKNFTPSRAQPDLRVSVRCRACTGSKRRRSRPDEAQGDRRRRREAVGQQVEELARCSRRIARKPDVRSGIVRPARNPASQLSTALPMRRRPDACVDGSRAPTTRSYSPSAATRRQASSGLCCPSPSRISTNSPVARRMPDLHRCAVALVVGMSDDGGAGARRRARPSSSVDPSSTTRISCHGAACRRAATTSPTAAPSLNAGMTTTSTRDQPCRVARPDERPLGVGGRRVAPGGAARPAPACGRGTARPRESCGCPRSGRRPGR